MIRALAISTDNSTGQSVIWNIMLYIINNDLENSLDNLAVNLSFQSTSMYQMYVFDAAVSIKCCVTYFILESY